MTQADASLIADLIAAIGADAVLIDPSDLEFYSMDVFRQGETPAAVVRPNSVDALQAAIRVAARYERAIVPRGGGASYTDAILTRALGAVVIDTQNLNRIVAISPEDMTVTVEAGVTWKALTDALHPHGLRTPFWGPFSGLYATVGGAVSQNSISLGTSAYGVSADSVLSMDIVTASGDIVRTGSAAIGAAPFFRHYGPDLTGVFTGDCGALGVKASITLRLVQAPALQATLSFGFRDFQPMAEAMAAVARTELASDNFGLDPQLQQGQLGRVNTKDALAALGVVIRTARNPMVGLLEAAKIASAGKSFLNGHPYSAHFGVEAPNKRILAGKLEAVRAAARRHGVEIVNTIPRFMLSNPFGPLFPMLGPKGERWAPQNGVLPFSQLPAFKAQLAEIYQVNAAQMARLGVTAGAMFETISTHAFLYEAVLYWPGAQTAYHERMLPEFYRNALPRYDHSEAALALVVSIRAQVQALYTAFGASHLQVGKSYPYMTGRETPARDLLCAIKHALDPNNSMNPGALGL